MTQEVKIGARVTMAGVVTGYDGCHWFVRLDKGKGSTNSILCAESFLTIENPVEPLKIGDTVFVLDTEDSVKRIPFFPSSGTVNSRVPAEIISICNNCAWIRWLDNHFATVLLSCLVRA